MPRILTVITQYYPYTGGAENVAQKIVENTNNGDFTNDVLTVAYDHIERKLGIKLQLDEAVETGEFGYRIFRVRPFRILRKQLDVGFFRHFLLLKMVLRIIRLSRNYDLVHAHTYYWPSYAAILAKRVCRIPVVVTGHNSIELLAGEVGSGAYPKQLLTCLKDANAYVAINDQIYGQAIELAEINASKVLRIDNSVDTERFSPIFSALSRAAVLEKYNVEPDEILVTYHGRYDESKNIPDLITAVSEVRRKGIPVKCIMHGRGDMRVSLVGLIDDLDLNDVVKIYDYVDNVEDILGVSDIYVLPSRVEGLPLALLEAMAGGSICLATNIPGSNEVISDGQTGFLFEPGDVSGLAGHIIHICEGMKHDRPFLDVMRENGAQLIEERYTQEAMIKRYKKLFESIISSSSECG